MNNLKQTRLIKKKGFLRQTLQLYIFKRSSNVKYNRQVNYMLQFQEVIKPTHIFTPTHF